MSSLNSVVCEEFFDDLSHPSIDEIRDYAAKIGIDPESEPHMLPLAAEGLMRALPPGWKPCLDEKKKSYYYYNNITGKTQWEHPLDDIYRGLVTKKRTESQSLSLGEPNEDATYTRDDLPSYEEPPIFAKSLEPFSLGARKKELKTSPMKAKNDFRMKSTDFKVDISPKMIRQKSEERPVTALTGNRKVGLSMSSSFDLKTDLGKERKDFRLSGGGSMFLKTNTKKPDSHDIDVNDEGKNDATQPFRGILRERSFVESTKSIDEEDRKVRFNFDDNPAITLDFELSDDDMKLDQAKQNVLPDKDVLPQEILKLIKPNPKDFIKAKDHEISAQISDSEDESILKSLDKNDKKLEYIKMMKNDQIAEKDDLVSEEIEKYKSDQTVIIRELKLCAEKELEDMKKTIWEEKNEEICRYREELQFSHKTELERILSTEKNKYEENIKSELSNLRLEMESRNLGALEAEKIRLETELGKLKESLQMKYKIEEEKLDQIILDSFERKKEKLQKMYDEKLEELEKDLSRGLEKHKDELIVTHNAILDQLKQNQQGILDEIRKDFKSEEKIIRREHESQISDLKKKVNLNIDNEINNSSHGSKDPVEDLHFEKVRCEKRLLEDKYRCLKDKYLRLKTDVKLSIEKRNRKREQSATTTTGSETERSNSINKERSPHRSPSHLKTCDKPPLQKHDLNSNRQKAELKNARTFIIQDLDTSTSDRSCKTEEKYLKNEYDSSDNNPNPGRSRKKLFSRIKSSSTSRVNNNKSKKTQRSCSPVENLRRQLQKLEDLEDQFPQNPQSDTYHLRYPFSDGQKFEGSSELEFFRHRIHLERDSIKRAKESLRTQKCLFQQRQNDLKLKHGSMARHTLQQLCQEEKDLTDMEVSLHRTRSLLGEKVIRLRHLEQSLQRATAVTTDQLKQDDATLSDLSSHSASSGISSTEFATAADGMKAVLRGEHLEESSEIIQSLENLNSEIREIWEVLNQQQQAGNIASVMPLPLVYPDLGWPLLGGNASLPAPPSIPTLADRLHNYRQHVALSNAQSTVVTHAANQGATTTLVERTRNLRHWLRQAGIDAGPDGAPTQATL